VPGRFDHVTISASDFAASRRVYDAALGALGFVPVIELVDEEEDASPAEAAGWAAGPDGPAIVWLVDGLRPTTGAHLALHVDDRDAVIAFHQAALAVGGRSHDAPRRWPIYRRGEFHAIVADPDGNLIEAIAPE
jgi:catechol 2,3-dioxygenase-like lactoylglutathione lyase family enzyme